MFSFCFYITARAEQGLCPFVNPDENNYIVTKNSKKKTFSFGDRPQIYTSKRNIRISHAKKLKFREHGYIKVINKEDTIDVI